MNTSPIVLITGEMRAGKSTLCQKLVQRCRSKGITVTGLITQHPAPHSLEALALHTTERYLLTYPFESELGTALTHFRMNPAALARSAEALPTSFPTQVFILDELGPLELLRGEGWIAALHLLAGEEYEIAFIVVRPALLAQAVQQLPRNSYTVANITLKNRELLAESLFQQAWQSVENQRGEMRRPACTAAALQEALSGEYP
ncbi:MAG TPA: DUF2478 domain-containing protein [Thermoflexia bacterium]|nr:DUF2478 domain-containing protein [Thermoflexia bacterium]